MRMERARDDRGETVRDGEEKIVVNVEVDATAGKDKVSAKVDAGIKDLLGKWLKRGIHSE